jgi:hypothetical protein
MALQQINWLQIDTERIPLDSSGSASLVILGGTGSNYLESAYIKNLFTSGTLNISGGLETSGDAVIGGNLTVKGTTTIISSSIIDLGDNIISLNGTADSFGGIVVQDPSGSSLISGSLLWDTNNEYWIAGPQGSEEKIVLLSDLSESLNRNVWQETGSFWAASSDLQVTGSIIIKGDLRVEGTTTLVQTIDENIESLIVSGAMSIVRNELSPQIVSASLTIQNLGTLADRSLLQEIDCGDGFF